MTDVTYLLSESNELTISWSLTARIIEVCEYVYMDIELIAKNCEIDCTISRFVPITDYTFKFPQTLEACGAYEFQLLRSGVLTFSEDFTAKEQFEKVVVTTIEQIDPVLLRVSWAEPTMFKLCEKKFRVIFRQSNLENALLTAETSSLSQVSNTLEPCEDYTVSIYPMTTILGESLLDYGESASHTMETSLPTGIRDLTVTYDDTDTSIKIEWQSPESGSRCVKSYDVTIESSVDTRTRNATVTYESFNNVFACIDYVIKINSVTINDLKAAEVLKEIRIPSRGNLSIFFANNKSFYFLQFSRSRHHREF